MRFWDTSALVSLVFEEPASAECRRAVREDPEIAVWMFAETEVLSAIHRARRGSRLAGEEIGTAERRLGQLLRRGRVLEDATLAKNESIDVIRRYALRTGDALQLAAARLWSDGSRKRRTFVVADVELADAARRDGFDVRLMRA